MRKWFQIRTTWEWICVGFIALVFSYLSATTSVYPSHATIEAILAGTQPPLICDHIADYLVGLTFAIIALVLFICGGIKGKSGSKYFSFICAGLSMIFVIGHELSGIKALHAYAKWRGWIN